MSIEIKIVSIEIFKIFKMLLDQLIYKKIVLHFQAYSIKIYN